MHPWNYKRNILLDGNEKKNKNNRTQCWYGLDRFHVCLSYIYYLNPFNNIMHMHAMHSSGVSNYFIHLFFSPLDSVAHTHICVNWEMQQAHTRDLYSERYFA